LGEVFRSKGKFFHQKVRRTKIEFEFDRCGVIAIHAEYVDIAGAVVCFVLPHLGQYFDGANARYFEEFVFVFFGAIAPDLYVIGGESIRFDVSIADIVAMCRSIIFEDNGVFIFNGLYQLSDITSVLSAYNGFGQNVVVVNGIELLFEVLLEQVVLVNAFDSGLENIGFFFGEVNELANVFEIGGGFVEFGAVVGFFNDEPGLAKGVDIAVNGTGRNA